MSRHSRFADIVLIFTLMKPGRPQIFVSYRRADSEAITGRIAERLAARYGQDRVKIDIDSIPFGFDFRESIDRFLATTDVVVVVIGPDWCGHSEGRARIQEETDYVRKEVEVALERKLPIVPVLVGHAVMPSPAELPATLADFAYRNAVPLSPGRDFNVHIGRLIDAIDKIVAIAGLRPAALQAPKRLTLGLRLPGPPGRALAELATVALGVAALPIGGLYAALTPASPLSLPGIAVAAALATFLVQFQLLRQASPERRQRSALAAWMSLAGFTAVFLILLNFFTFQIPGSSRRFAAGFACTADAQQLYGQACPFIDTDLVSGASYHAEALWTTLSIAIIRIALALTWLAIFAAMAWLAATFAAERYELRSS